MTYFLKVDEDYEYNNTFLSKLSDWLRDNVPDTGEINEAEVHYGFQYVASRPEDVAWRDLWDKIFNEYMVKHAIQIEAHFGYPMPPTSIAGIQKTYCNAWTIFRINFCYVEDAETSGMYFYMVENVDTHMVQFQLTEM